MGKLFSKPKPQPPPPVEEVLAPPEIKAPVQVPLGPLSKMGFNFPQEPSPPTDFDRDLVVQLKPVSEKCLALEDAFNALELQYYKAVWSPTLEEQIPSLRQHIDSFEKSDLEWIHIHLKPIIPQKPHQKVSVAVCTSTHKKYKRLANALREKAIASLRGGLSEIEYKNLLAIGDEKKREETYHDLWSQGLSAYFNSHYQRVSPDNPPSDGIQKVSMVIASYLSVPERSRKKSSLKSST